MNEHPKSIWKKPLPLPGLLLAWLVLMIATTLIFAVIALIIKPPRTLTGIGILGPVFGTVLLCLWLFIRWLCCWKNFRRFLFGLVCFITLVALFYAVEDWRGKHTWDQFERSWEAKGEHFDLASVVPPRVPDDQNFAMTPIAYTSYGQILTRDGKVIPFNQRDTNFVDRMLMPISDNGDDPTNAAGNRLKGKLTNLDAWQSYYRQRAVITNEFPVSAEPQSAAKDVLLALSKYDSAIEELRVASQLPYSRYPVDYDNESPWAILLPHLAPLKNSAQLLQLRSAAELQNGQSDKALDDVRLMLQLTDKIRSEPFLISHLVRLAMMQLALQTIWEGLAEHKWSDAQLVALDAELGKFDFAADYKLGMHGELGGQTGEMDLIRRQPERMNDVSDFGNGGNGAYFPAEVAVHLFPTGWFYQNEYQAARLMQDYYIPAADASKGTFSPDVAREGDGQLAAETKSFGPFILYERLMLSALGNAVPKFAYGQASVNLARTAIALERYRLAHGEYPESLDALAPQFIAEVPHDVIGGQPLKYRRDADGSFVLYSVGWNETDDGGTTVFKESSTPPLDLENGDWVWKYPPQT